MSKVFAQISISVTSALGVKRNLLLANDFANISAETKALALSGDSMYTFIDSFVPKIKDRVGAVGLKLEIWGQNTLEEEKRLLTTLDLSLSSGPVFPDKSIESCVYYVFRIVDEVLARRWKLTGFQVFGEPDGQYFL